MNRREEIDIDVGILLGVGSKVGTHSSSLIRKEGRKEGRVKG